MIIVRIICRVILNGSIGFRTLKITDSYYHGDSIDFVFTLILYGFQ